VPFLYQSLFFYAWIFLTFYPLTDTQANVILALTADLDLYFHAVVDVRV